MRVVMIFVLSMIFALSVFAQDQNQTPNPSTKLEAFQTNTGMVIIRGYTSIGALLGLGGTIEISAREFREASNPTRRATGISISVTETSRLERENTSYIDADEIESLLQGLDYISKINKDVTSFDNFEVEYKTKGDFSVIVFNNTSGDLSLAISSGRVSKATAYLKLAQISELKKLISDAQLKL